VIVQMKLSKNEEAKLEMIAETASANLGKEYNVATVCLNIVRVYLDEHVIEYSKEVEDLL